MDIVRHLLNKAKHNDVNRQVKISLEEDESEKYTSRARKTQSSTVEEEEADNGLEVKVNKSW